MTLSVVGLGKKTCLAIVVVVCSVGLSCGIFSKTAVSPSEFSQDNWLSKAITDSEKAGSDLVEAGNTNSGEAGLGIVAASRKDMPAAASALASAARQDAESVAKIIVAVDPENSTSLGEVVLEAARKDASSMGVVVASAARDDPRAVGKIVSLVIDKDAKTAAEIIIVGAKEDSGALGAVLADCAITDSRKTGAAVAIAAANAPELAGAAISSSLKIDPGSVSDVLLRSSALDPDATTKALVSGTFLDPVALALLGEQISSDAWMPEVVPKAGGDILAGPEWKASLPSDDSVPISGILTRFNQTPEDVGIEISRLEPDVRDSREGRTVHSYVKLNPADFDNDDVMVARVAFSVEKSWLEGSGLHRWSVEFSRFNESIGSWQPVTAKYLNEDETHIHYSVPVSGFSEWSISGSPSVKPPVPVSDVVFATAAVSGGAYMSALAEVENSGPYPVDRSLSLWIDSQVHSSQTVTIPAGVTMTIDFRATVGYGSHTLRIDRFSRMVSFALPENPTSFNTPVPSPTYTPVPTITPTPSPTHTPVPTITPTPSPTHTLVPTITPMPSPTHTLVPTIAPMPSPTHTPVPTITPTPTYTPAPTITPTPGIASLPTAEKLLTLTRISTSSPLPTKIAVNLPTATSTLVSTPSDHPTPTLTATSLPPATPSQSTVIASVPAPSPPTATPAPTVTPSPVTELETKDTLPDGVPEYMRNVWLCTNGSAPGVDDLTTSQSENNRCVVEVEYTDEFAVVTSNGIPNHDYESTLGCCAGEIDYEWKLPLSPQNSGSITYAPDRGAVAVSVNGVPFFGPEDGPGGDAVAFHHGYYEEDRQRIVLGLCGAHSAGTVFHYHFDGNCVHWHPEEQD
ncbi:MAG: PGF-pre-PGF domain-containing protein, partial [Chloroflexota bacterium]|nr:PGF-pre-PGF domain-containing protein [Chloroflexota bacterium]